MRFSLSLLFSFVLVFPAAAQFIIRGQVRDSLSAQPAPFTSYVVQGTHTGGLTDTYGRFELKTTALPVTLVFHAIGYETKQYTISDTLPRIVLLKLQSKTLASVSITADKVETYHEKDAFTVLDYRFYDNYLLTLSGKRNTKRKYLVLMDTEGNTVSSVTTEANAEKLYDDCLGAIHLLSPDSSWQLYYDYVNLQQLYGVSRDSFMRVMSPCKCMVDDYYYFGWLRYRGLRMEYYSVNWYRKGEYVPLRSIADSSKITGLQTNYDLQYFLAQRRRRPAPDPRYAVPLDFLKANLDSFRMTEKLSDADARWLTPVKAPIYRVGKRIVIINTVDSLLECYEKDGTKVSTVRLSVLYDKTLQDDWVVDDVRNELYAVFEKDGITTLRRIDMSNGLVLKTFTIPDRTYIQQLRIRDGVAYFLWRDPHDDAPRKLLRRFLD